MRYMILVGLCLLSTACNNGDSFNRGYVISQSQETALDTDSTEMPED